MSRSRLVLALMFVALIAALVAGCGPGGGASAGGATVTVTGSEFSYTPNNITVKSGEKVTVNFKNGGTVQHTFVLKDLNFKLTADPGQTVSGSFTAPSAAGTHEFHCDVAGHLESGMKGNLVVQ